MATAQHGPWRAPQDVTDLDIAFPTSVDHLLPDYAAVPAEFKGFRDEPHVEFVEHWFFHGADVKRLSPKPGIDASKAIRHLRVCMGSWEPKHEHKIAGVAYLLSLWFTLEG